MHLFIQMTIHTSYSTRRHTVAADINLTTPVMWTFIISKIIII